jgi:putative Mn2+ efflux pump MntP
MIAAINAPTFFGGLVLAILGLLMWAERVKRRKAREATKDDHHDSN